MTTCATTSFFAGIDLVAQAKRQCAEDQLNWMKCFSVHGKMRCNDEWEQYNLCHSKAKVRTKCPVRLPCKLTITRSKSITRCARATRSRSRAAVRR